jgi:hypothetical protein
MASVNDRIWFAGEAAHEALWGTVGGAWESGERARCGGEIVRPESRRSSSPLRRVTVDEDGHYSYALAL